MLGYAMRMTRTIAVVEDEPTIRANYRDALTRYGYRVVEFGDRRAAEQAFRGALPDLVIVDIGLEDEPEGGFDLCRALRARSEQLPIIFLTARDSELDAVSGLRLGADDYLTKDISNAHLIARVAALFRRVDVRVGTGEAEQVLRVGELVLDPERLEARWRDQPIELTVTEFWIVHALVRHPGHVKSRQQLMDAASLVVDESTMTSHIKRIRRKLEAVDPGFSCLVTVHGAGYRWRAQQ